MTKIKNTYLTVDGILSPIYEYSSDKLNPEKWQTEIKNLKVNVNELEIKSQPISKIITPKNIL